MSLRLEEIEQELTGASIYRFVNRRELGNRERRKASIGAQMILPRQFKKLLDPWEVELSLSLLGKEPDVALTDKDRRNELRAFLRSARYNTLEELVALYRVYVEERVYRGKKRYLAVLEKDPNMVCEITKEAFQRVVESGLVENVKARLGKQRRHD